MKLYIDADGCPVVDLALKIATATGLESYIVCDTSHQIDRPNSKTIVVSKGADSVDFTIVNLVKAGDVILTQDYGLAAMGLSRGAKVITQNGMIISNENIDGLLASRYFSQKLRNSKVRMKGPAKRTTQHNQQFEIGFRMLLDTAK